VILSVLTDDRLARLAGEGDRSAFEEIFERYHQQLYRYCVGLLSSPEDARDALQATMERAWRSIDRQRVSGGLRPWLYRIAHNESMSMLRTRDRVAPQATVEEPDLGPDAAGQAADRERIRELLSDVRSLPDHQRGALLMRELGGLDYTQVGAALAVSAAAARQAVYEARIALHSLLEGRDMDCQDVRRKVSDGDGRALRGRRVRAHLSACAGCRSFRKALTTRPAQLALALPVLPPAGAAAVLGSISGVGPPAAGGGGPTGGTGGFLRSARSRRLAMLLGTVAAIATAAAIVMPRGHVPSRDAAVRRVPPAPAAAASSRRSPRPHRQPVAPPAPQPVSSAAVGYNSAVPDSAIAAGRGDLGSAARRPAGGGAGSAGGGLPFTGMEVGLMAILGLALAGLGVLLRRLSAAP
jgi:RNA polymerase sigma factor (sigma-70 family)